MNGGRLWFLVIIKLTDSEKIVIKVFLHTPVREGECRRADMAYVTHDLEKTFQVLGNKKVGTR